MKHVETFDLLSPSQARAYEELLNTPGVQIMGTSDFFAVVSGGEGSPSDPTLIRSVDYRRNQPTGAIYTPPIG